MPVSFLLVARLFPQELASLDKETVEPVMMNPVSRPFERHRAGIGEIVHAAIVEMADRPAFLPIDMEDRSEEHTSELQSLMRISFAVFCLKKKINLYSENQRYDIYYIDTT